jgi:adenylate cyclase
MSQALFVPGIRYAIGSTFLGILLMTFVFELDRKLGPGVLRNWLLGRYREPRIEERAFAFVDLRDSTALAEELGPLKFSALIRDFFDDMTEALTSSRGTVSHYIGDEAVLAWTMKDGKLRGDPLRFYQLFRDSLAARTVHYIAQYGVVPRFKAGAHCGPAVVTEVGRIKSEIVFHGDVLNTTARITALCGELEEEFLMSHDLAALLPPKGGVVLKDEGQHALKGKTEAVSVFGVRVVPAAELPAVKAKSV